MKNTLVLLMVGIAMVGCGQNSVTNVPDAKADSAGFVQTIVKGLGPDPVNTSPVKFMSGSDNGLIAAQGEDGYCQPGWFCMYADSNYNGTAVGFRGDIGNVGGFNDRATSYWNRTDRTVCVYVDTWYRGKAFAFGSGASTYNIGLNTRQYDIMGTEYGNLNDTTSSVSYC